ncbi:macrophage mannose receptor 1-like isoform X2 [Brachyhypopomus gauderio]|uniref:macrophage mannose receptor 1-like isoform X2 n=1 Tax=Brachyhypopomus gauderio TaxID=698409 RepID=UPI004042405E
MIFKMKKIPVVIVLLLKMLQCSAQLDGNFLIFNAHSNTCLGDILEGLVTCNPQSTRHQYRWTSENRIFNVAQKKCLGAGSKSEGNKLQWYICDAKSDLQKWECDDNLLFGLKNESLYLSVQKGTNLLTLSKDPGDEGKWTIHGTLQSICSRPYEELYTLSGNAFGHPCHFPFNYKNHWYANCTIKDSSTNRLWCATDTEYDVNQLWGYCPTQQIEYWIKNPRTGVYYQVNEDSALTWYQARKSCQQQGGDLLSITEPHEQTFISGAVPYITEPHEQTFISGAVPYITEPHEQTFISGAVPYITEPHEQTFISGAVPYITEPHEQTFISGAVPYITEPHEQTFISGAVPYITEPHEQTFISGLFQKESLLLWIGLNSLDVLSGWHWINRQPLRFLKWLSGQPSFKPGHSCGVINQHYSKWSTDICSAKHGYICQRGISTPTVPPVVHTGYCHSPWIPYSGHCYFLNRIKRTWLDARDACRREGGDLLSILNTEEQSFIISQLGYLKTDELWIGFNDLKTPMLFEWSDHSSVPFAWWDVNEPSHNAALKEDCVLMTGEEGKWADNICQQKYGYICKKKTNLNPSTNDTVVKSPGCKPGWSRYGFYCYLAGPTTKTFEEAKQMCATIGSYLADIANRVENAFLVSLIGARPEKHFWIGLSNQRDRHTFEWTNANNVLFTHFNAGMPGGKQGCVAMTTGLLAGLWDVLSCTDKEKYICKQNAEGLVTTAAAPTSPAATCSEGWSPLPNRDYCFKLFEVQHKEAKTWSEARDFCMEAGGDLLSIHSDSDIQEDTLLTGYELSAWIGYSIQDPTVGYVWSDGSSTSYESWKEGQPRNLNNMENCVELTYRQWENKAKWNGLQCEDRRNWICEIQKGETPKEVNITSKSYNRTEDGWIIFKGYQYYIHDTSLTMEEARWFCKHRHGDLVVINDEEERVFLWHQALKIRDDIYIGMNIDRDKSFMWMDGSPVVFQIWAPNQPAFVNNEENCVKMTWYSGLWESEYCGNKQNFVCKRSGLIPVNSTAGPTEPTIGGCDPHWVKFEKKCYKIVLDVKTWSEARSYCRRLGGDLSSVHNRLQQAFLTSRMNDSTPDLWLGFSDFASFRTFRWTDGSPVSFTCWAKGHPTRLIMRPWSHSLSFMESYEPPQTCVVIGAKRSPELGKWMSKDCSETNGFICSRTLDDFIMPSPTELPKAFIKLGSSSYMVVQSTLTWEEAKHHCEAEGAYLASIRDTIAQSYIELQTHKFGQPMWIGLNSDETGGYFHWIDNWHLTLEKWDYSEPKMGHPCVYVDVNGKWRTSHCNQTYYSLCKKSADIAQNPLSGYPGMCPELTDEEPKMIWLSYKENCYAFITSKESWNTASQICMTRGANLVSIIDPPEGKFVENYISLLSNSASNFWIGLFKTHEGHWLWQDNSVLDYINWNDFNDDFYYYYNEYDTCAWISGSTKHWEKYNCEDRASFICKAAKVITPTTETTLTGDGKSQRAFVGFSVIAMVAVLCVLVGLAYFYYRWSHSNHTGASMSGDPLHYSIVESVPEEENLNTLVK